MIEISEEVVRGTAQICGPHSGAAQAIANAEARRAAGEQVKFYKARGCIIVRGQSGAKEGGAMGDDLKGAEHG